MANTQRDCAGVGQPVKNQNLRGPLSPPAAKTASSCSAFSVGPWTREIFFTMKGVESQRQPQKTTFSLHQPSLGKSSASHL